jgi:uncharacterized protein with FMN-binding domain
MIRLADNKTAVAVIAGLSLVGSLAGCASTTSAESNPAPEPTTEGTAPNTSPADYADGTYTESGSYQSPNGTESVKVTVTLANGIVTAVDVVGNGESSDSKFYQGEFIGGIDAVVVGKKIDDINVTKVAGSSLTSGGFTSALDAIKVDAAR